MKIKNIHSWEVSYSEARAIQEKVSRMVEIKPLGQRVNYIAGADVAYSVKTNRLMASVIVFDFPLLNIIEEVWSEGEATFPYIPGLLTFREAPILLRAFAKLDREPDVILFDGQGIAHPRRIGLASHVGVILGRPAIGCAKSRLIGEYTEPGKNKGDKTPLKDKGIIIGTVLRTRTRVKPIFVSVGHRVDLGTAVKIVLACTGKYRLPEPTRQAHLSVTRLFKSKS